MGSEGGRNGGSTPIFITVIVLSLSAFMVSFFLSKTEKMEETAWVFIAGVVICFISIPIFLYVILKNLEGPQSEKKNTQNIEDKQLGGHYFFYVFSIFAFTSMVDLALALTLDGFTSMLEFYLEKGEEYLKSSYGCFINYWDGTFHYFCYLILIYLMLTKNRKNGVYEWVGWIWFGSIYNSIIVFLPGNLLGPWSSHIHLSYLLNIPYILFPVLFAFHLLSISSPISSSPQTTKKQNNNKNQRKRSIMSRPFDLLLVMIGGVMIGLIFIRSFVVLNGKYDFLQTWASDFEPHLLSPTVWPTLQTLVFAYYFTPAILFAIYSLITSDYYFAFQRPCFITLFGAVLQGQFSYIGSALHPLLKYPDPAFIPIPSDGLAAFWAINLSFVVYFALLVYRFSSSPKSKTA